MTAVEAAGLPELTELYNSDAISQVADGPNTEVTFFDDNGEHFFSVYSLRIADQKDPQVLELAALIDLIDKLAATSPEAGPFSIERLQILLSAQPPNTDDPLAVRRAVAAGDHAS